MCYRQFSKTSGSYEWSSIFQTVTVSTKIPRWCVLDCPLRMLDHNLLISGKKNGASQCFIFLSNDLWSTHSVESIVLETSMNSPNMEEDVSRWLRIWNFLNCSQLLLSVVTSTKELFKKRRSRWMKLFCVLCAAYRANVLIYICKNIIIQI
jgi:hypothetical protein